MSFLLISNAAFGWIAIVDTRFPEVDCFILFAALLNMIVTCRRAVSLFWTGVGPILTMLFVVQIRAFYAKVPLDRLLPLTIAVSIGAGFCLVVWRAYISSLDQAARAQASAEAATAAKTDFLANMSHELRTPLNGVVAMSSLLQRTQMTTAQQGMVKIIRDAAATLQVLLSDVLDLAKVEAGKIDLQSEVLLPADLVRHVGALFQAPAAEKGLDFMIEAGAASDCAVLGDGVRLSQILTNLCSNAVKFTQAGEVSLRVSAVPNNDRCAIRFDVTDSGIGISPEAQALIFERFAQAEGSITRRFGGTGLGLAISKQLAELMGGDLSVSSTEGVGSTFSLRLDLPRVDEAAARRNGALPQARPHETKTSTLDGDASQPVLFRSCEDNTTVQTAKDNARVLLVEDHPVNCQIIQMILSDFVALDMAADGAQGVEAFGQKSYDLILMDMQMPVMDGVSATRAIRRLEALSRQPRTPIVMLTANAQPEHLELAMQAGADHYLTKPVAAEALIDLLNAVLAAAPEVKPHAQPEAVPAPASSRSSYP